MSDMNVDKTSQICMRHHTSDSDLTFMLISVCDYLCLLMEVPKFTSERVGDPEILDEGMGIL